jgi:hypothetical protein
MLRDRQLTWPGNSRWAETSWKLTDPIFATS